LRHCGDLKTPLTRILSKSFSTFALARSLALRSFLSPSLSISPSPSLRLSFSFSFPFSFCTLFVHNYPLLFRRLGPPPTRDGGLKNFRCAKVPRSQSTLVATIARASIASSGAERLIGSNDLRSESRGISSEKSASSWSRSRKLFAISVADATLPLSAGVRGRMGVSLNFNLIPCLIP